MRKLMQELRRRSVVPVGEEIKIRMRKKAAKRLAAELAGTAPRPRGGRGWAKEAADHILSGPNPESTK